jgi:hypothetical protein
MACSSIAKAGTSRPFRTLPALQPTSAPAPALFYQVCAFGKFIHHSLSVVVIHTGPLGDLVNRA